tara:strand:- start:383 stop:673 length:291 start_codon:yes stop_codon:yes gene_type:complete
MKENEHGGKREGAGRKPKADEIKLIERLDRIINEDEAIEKLKELIQEGNFNALKLYMEYRFGKPKETIENINKNYDAGKLTKEEIELINKALENKY